jgi:TolA-binding protein
MRAHQQLEQYRESMAAGSFETIIARSEQVLAENETTPPADIALYVLGEVYAHPDFAGRDYAVSELYFTKLIKNFPDSPLISEAKTYISLFETIAAREQETAALKEKSAAVAAPRKVVKNQNYQEAVQRNLRLLKESGKNKPADEALYNLGLIYANADNPAKDYKKSQGYFQALTRQFPNSELAEEARVWLGLFETIDKIQQIDLEIEQQKKELTR